MDIKTENIERAFRILPHQGTGVYRLDNCEHGDLVALKASDPYEAANVCMHCRSKLADLIKDWDRQQEAQQKTEVETA